jgi:alkaline phosphatase D
MATLTKSPIVGGVTSGEAKINCRTDSAADIAIEYAENKNFRNSLVTPAVGSLAANDYAVTIDLVGLGADTAYWYRVLVDGVIQDTGYVQRFRTFPSGSQAFKFAVFADVAPQDKVAACYQSGKNDGALFALQIGDCDHRNPSALAEMRAMHHDMCDPSKSHGGDFTQHITSKMCVSHVWDDHDYGGNDTDKTFAGRADALKAFEEHWPTYDRPNTDGIWYSFVCGDAEFFMLDTRSQRDPNTAVDDANKSMLDGDSIIDGQKQWLKDGLLASTATWKFLVSTVTANTSARPASTDLWRSFSTERDEIRDFIANNGISNVIVISGDIHTGGAVDDGSNSGLNLPEISVPHTNLNKGNTKNLGTWSEGVTSGSKGYALISVSTTSVTLEAKSETGSVRHSLTL